MRAKCEKCGVELGLDVRVGSTFYCSASCLGPVELDPVPYLDYSYDWVVPDAFKGDRDDKA